METLSAYQTMMWDVIYQDSMILLGIAKIYQN